MRTRIRSISREKLKTMTDEQIAAAIDPSWRAFYPGKEALFLDHNYGPPGFYLTDGMFWDFEQGKVTHGY